MEELAEEAGITVRTLRFYRERGLIQPPRREGRIAWYDDHHLARLRTITGLLERGHTLNGIADLAATFDSGRDVAEVLGLGEPTEETPVRLTPEQLADYFKDQATAENLSASMELGYLGIDGDEIVHISSTSPGRLVRTGTGRLSRSTPCSPRAARCVSTPTPWPTSSYASCAPTPPTAIRSNCARSHTRWSTPSCRWLWTADCVRTRPRTGPGNDAGPQE